MAFRNRYGEIVGGLKNGAANGTNGVAAPTTSVGLGGGALGFTQIAQPPSNGIAGQNESNQEAMSTALSRYQNFQNNLSRGPAQPSDKQLEQSQINAMVGEILQEVGSAGITDESEKISALATAIVSRAQDPRVVALLASAIVRLKWVPHRKEAVDQFHAKIQQMLSHTVEEQATLPVQQQQQVQQVLMQKRKKAAVIALGIAGAVGLGAWLLMGRSKGGSATFDAADLEDMEE